MTRHFCITLALASIACMMSLTLVAQTPETFEVASVRPSGTEPLSLVGLRITPGQARFSFLSLQDYIGMAYGVRVYQISGPDWLASARFDINAKFADDPLAARRVPAMLRALLEERFKMRTHRENREFPVYSLEVAPKGPRLIRLPEEEQTPGQLTIATGPSEGRKITTLGGGTSLALGDNRFEAKRVTMTMLADTLSRFVDRPVVDMTQLEGRYDVAFSLSPEDFQAMMTRSVVAGGFGVAPEMLRLLDAASTVAIPDALEKVGLLLRRGRAPIEVLVIDAAEKTPTEN